MPSASTAGDEASCLSLYKPSQPSVLGVRETLVNNMFFSWAATKGRSRQAQHVERLET